MGELFERYNVDAAKGKRYNNRPLFSGDFCVRKR